MLMTFILQLLQITRLIVRTMNEDNSHDSNNDDDGGGGDSDNDKR